MAESEKDKEVPEAGKPLPAAAQRALEEAAERRRNQPPAGSQEPENGGRKGPDPVRYGDWEKGGIVSDF